MTHAVQVCMKRYYNVYVEDDGNEMTNEQIEQKAREMALEDDNLVELCIDYEEQDVVSTDYLYDLDDGGRIL